jgi:hypothetical protein
VTITYAPQSTDPHAPEWAREPSHLAGALEVLKDAVNAHWPKRDHTSDGYLGDARHVAELESSDHNPWWNATVRAADFDVDGIDAPWLAEQLRLLGASGDKRLHGGYVIYNRKITKPDWSGWTAYTNGDPHTTHIHLSTTPSAECESTALWPFLEAAPSIGPDPTQPAHPAIVPAAAVTPAPAAQEWTGPDAVGAGEQFRAELGNNGPRVQQLQQFLRNDFPAYAGDLAVDGFYGPKTQAVVAEFNHRVAATDPNCPEDDRSGPNGLANSDGQNIGPRGARALTRYGFR